MHINSKTRDRTLTKSGSGIEIEDAPVATAALIELSCSRTLYVLI